MGKSVTFKSSGDFKHLNGFFKRFKEHQFYKNLDYYGQKGVQALSEATPVDTGVTANSWDYNVYIGNDESGKTSEVTITWTNSSVTKNGIPIVILLQYGHVTGSGGYVQGKDFINPAIKPIFDEIQEAVWREVTK